MATDTRSAEPFEENLQASGEAFVRGFANLLQMPRIHDAKNRLAIAAARQFIEAGCRLLGKTDNFTLEMRHGRIFIQGKKLLMRRQSAVYIFSLLSLCENLNLYGLKFHPGMAAISHDRAYALARCLLIAKKQDRPLEWLAKQLSGKDFGWIDILSGPGRKSDISRADRAETAHRMYSYAYRSIREVSEQVIKEKRAGIRKPLRIVQEITDVVMYDKSILLGLSTIRDYDDYTYTHSVNVSIQSVCLGHRIGLSRQSLVRLGICALFHDLGKVDIPIDIISKPGPLDEAEFKQVQQHSINSVRQILKLQAHSDLIAQIILPPFEHHLNYDLSGYPAVNWRRPISLFGRIIEICDVFDALTAPRIYRQAPFSPDRALGALWKKAGTAFDPLLVKWFVNMMGVYPVGTVVALNTGRIGLIQDGGDIQDGRVPRVLLLHPENGSYARGKLVDLNQRDSRSGNYIYTIQSTHHASEFGIQPALYLMNL